MPDQRKLRDERIQIYFDCICGTVCSIVGFICIIYGVSHYGIANYVFFTMWLVFWISWFSLSVFVLLIGLYSWYKAKHFDPSKQRKDLRAPIVS